MVYRYRGSLTLDKDPDVKDESGSLAHWQGVAGKWKQQWQAEKTTREELQQIVADREATIAGMEEAARRLREESESAAASVHAHQVKHGEWRRRHDKAAEERDRLRSVLLSYQATVAELREVNLQLHLTSQMLRQRLTDPAEGVLR